MNDFLLCLMFCCQNGPFQAETAVGSFRAISLFDLLFSVFNQAMFILVPVVTLVSIALSGFIGMACLYLVTLLELAYQR